MMQNTLSTTAVSDTPVRGFIHFPVPHLAVLKRDLSLSLSIAGLQLCQKQFAAELRDPSVGELRFLDVLSRSLASQPQNTRLAELYFSQKSDARIWQDICRCHDNTAENSAPTLASAARTSALILTKAGRLPGIPQLHADQAVNMALHTFGISTPLSLQIGDAAAVLTAEKVIYPPAATGQILLALSADRNASLAATVTRFQHTYAALFPIPLAAIGAEGLGVHLSSFPCGVEFDLCSCADPNLDDPASLATCLAHTVIFAVPQQYAHYILTGGAPVRLVGRLVAGDRIIFRDARSVHVQLSRRFLCMWQSCRTLSLRIPKRFSNTNSAGTLITANDSHLLVGTCAKGNNVTHALMKLLARVFLSGACMETATLAAILTIPQGHEARALGMLLEWHRFTAELALPTADIKLQNVATDTDITLTVFGAAEKAATPSEEPRAAFSQALAAGDFTALRHTIYMKAF